MGADDRSNITLRQLRAFVAVAGKGSFTAAARELHLTQSALSVLVRELERELGVRLLDRHTRAVQLSDAGRDFLPYVEQAFVELRAGAATVAGLRDKSRGLVRVSAPQLMACTLMPQVMAAFRDRHPAIEVRLSDTLPELMLQRLAGGDVDVAIGPEAAVAADLVRQPVLRDRHWLIAPRDHPLARSARVRWSDVRQYPFIAPTKDFMKRLAPELARQRTPIVVEPAYEVSYMTTAIGMVAHGLGITACPSYSLPLVEGYGLTMRALSAPVFYRTVCAFRIAGRSLSPAAAAFLDTLEQVARRQRKTDVADVADVAKGATRCAR